MRNSTFKERVQRLMLKGESPRTFASKCGLPDAAIRNYLEETSKPSLIKIEMIAKACGVSVGWLAGDDTLLDNTDNSRTL